MFLYSGSEVWWDSGLATFIGDYDSDHGSEIADYEFFWYPCVKMEDGWRRLRDSHMLYIERGLANLGMNAKFVWNDDPEIEVVVESDYDDSKDIMKRLVCEKKFKKELPKALKIWWN